MEKKEKIVIVGLVVVILALVASLTYVFMDNNVSGNGKTVPDGMKEYNFDSEFTMAVPKDAKFLKNFNESFIEGFGQGVSYLDKSNKFAISYVDSPMVTNESINYLISALNASGNATFEFDGDLIISHNLKSNGNIGDTFEDSNFTYTVMLQRGHEIVEIYGNDVNLIRSMIKTLEWYE